MGWFPSEKRLTNSPTPFRSDFRHRSHSYSNQCEKWELDAKFFSALSKWTLDHPESTLDRVLERVDEAIENGKSYMELIPNTPFPARGLIQAVAQLIQLSVKISRAQREVRDFSLKIINWVNRVKESFTKAGNGRFTNITRNNLDSMRRLIDEICGWASERLEDSRWNLSNTKIEGEIRDFEARLNDAEKLFNVQSLVVLSGGLDAILQFLAAILQFLFISQSILTGALERLHETQEEHFKRILEEQERKRFIDESLRSYTVQNSTYNAQQRQPCAPNTRMEILEHIEGWIDDCSEASSENFLWLVGSPGCGKSAIIASIAEKCKSKRILGAQFFINRNNHNTTNPNCYFPTVARELAKRSDSIERCLYDALKGQIHSVDTPQEAARLFVDLVGKVASSDPTIPVVILFDGLDETNRDRLEDTATIFSQLFTKFRELPNVKILISSRPEDEILRSFKNKGAKELLLSTDDPNCLRDVKTFLTRRLETIAERYGLSSSGWPGDDEVNKLAIRASGLFIWAVTASNYINTRLGIQGKEILKTILNELDNDAMSKIHTLYSTILDFSYPKEIKSPWIFETFRRLIGAIMVLREPMNIHDLGELLDLREMPHSDHVDIRNFVENLRMLLVSDLNDVTEETIPRAHKSFVDFITGDHISERFRVDIETSNAEMALVCLHHLTLAYSDVHTTHYASKESDLKVLSMAVRYSLRFALSHVPHQGNSVFSVLSDHREVVESSQLDALLHHSTHHSCAGPLSFSLPSNHAFVRTSLAKKDLLWNPEDGSITSDISLPQHPPMAYLSPGGSRIFLRAFDRIYCMPEDSYDILSSTVLHPIQDYARLTDSFDGTKIAYATGQETIFLYDSSPNGVTSEIPNRHQANITLLELSQNCSYIASSSVNDGIVHIWDIDNRCYINLPDSVQHEYNIVCMEFAPDETMLISCDKHRAYIWEIPTCKRSHHSFKFNPGGYSSIAFSPDSQTFLAGSKEGYVSLWNPHTGKQIGEPWNVPTTVNQNHAVHQVAFRSCGKIALARCHRKVYVWNVPDATLLMVISYATNAAFSQDGSRLLYTDYFGQSCLKIHNLAPLLLNSEEDTFKSKQTMLSPGGNLLVNVTTDEILCWKLESIKVVRHPLKGGHLSVNVVAFSVDESRIAGVAEDGAVYLWNSTSQELLSSCLGCAHGASSLSFSPDGAHIVIKLADDQSVVLSAVDDKLVVLNEREAQKVGTVTKPTFFDLDKFPIIFGSNAAPNQRLKDVRWYPSRSDSVVWAYVNKHIIRAGKDGKFVVIPVG